VQDKHPYRQWCPDTLALAHLGDKWTLPIIRELSSGPMRFVELRRNLQQISTEQLRKRLNEMVADGLLAKQRYNEVPPRVDYWLTEAGEDALIVLQPLAQWAWKHAWPDFEGYFNVGANLRLAAAIYRPRRCLVGVTHILAGEFEYALSLGHKFGRAWQGPPRHPETVRCTIEGSTGSWTEALGPSANASALHLGGDALYASQVLFFLQGIPA
jgi:DNA-binding HxlR family transcriptional regulator